MNDVLLMGPNGEQSFPHEQAENILNIQVANGWNDEPFRLPDNSKFVFQNGALSPRPTASPKTAAKNAESSGGRSGEEVAG